MKEVQKYCGKTEEQVRKAYFSRKLPQLLAEIQTEGEVSDEGLQELAGLLQSLRDQETKLVDELSKHAPQIKFDEVKPPSVKELTSEKTDKEKAALENWVVQRDYSVERAKLLMRTVAKQLAKGEHIAKQKYMDLAHEITGLLIFLNEDRVYKEQLYMVRLTDMIDRYGISRREAEDRAKVTQEYGDYKNAQLLLEQIENFVMNCKKEYSDGQYS